MTSENYVSQLADASHMNGIITVYNRCDLIRYKKKRYIAKYFVIMLSVKLQCYSLPTFNMRRKIYVENPRFHTLN